MDMDLVPKYADESGDKSSGGIRIDPTQVQNLGLKTQKVTRGMLNYSQTIPANVSYNEYQFVIVQARSDGFVEKVYPLTIGDHVKKGTPLIDITIPEWVEAQSEFLLLSGTGGTSTQIKRGSGATSSGWYAGRGYSKAAFNPHNPDPFYH